MTWCHWIGLVVATQASRSVCQIVSNANLGTAAWHWHDTDQVHCHATTAIGYEPVASTRSDFDMARVGVVSLP
jgi:hypothetical protein